MVKKAHSSGYSVADKMKVYTVISAKAKTKIAIGAGTRWVPVGMDTHNPDEIELRDFAIKNWKRIKKEFNL